MANNCTSEKLRKIIDEMASGPDYVTMSDIIKKLLGDQIGSDETISYRDEYKILKTLMNRELRGKLDFRNGKNRSDGFRYKDGYSNYFKKQAEAKLIKSKAGDERTILLTGGLQMLLNQETISDPCIELECISELTNLNLVKVLAPFLGKRVISFKYLTGYVDLQNITLHPHLLKEYNSRWFLFGYVIEDEQPKVVNFSLDRIVYERKEDIKSHPDIQFKPAPDNCYQSYFHDIVGVTRMPGSPQEITIETTDYKVHKLIRTKPIHHSQSEIKPFTKGEGGAFTIQVIPNIELRTRLLSYGAGIRVVGQGEFQDDMRRVVLKMAKLYQ